MEILFNDGISLKMPNINYSIADTEAKRKNNLATSFKTYKLTGTVEGKSLLLSVLNSIKTTAYN